MRTSSARNCDPDYFIYEEGERQTELVALGLIVLVDIADVAE